MRYLKRTLNYPERITLSDPTHMISIVEYVTISVETLMIDNGCSLKKEFTKLICMNLLMILNLNIN